MANLRRFTTEDYYGFAGAELLPDGSRPFIADLEISSWKWDGGCIIISGDENEKSPIYMTIELWSKECETAAYVRNFDTLDAALRVGAYMPDKMNAEELKVTADMFGFEFHGFN